MSQARSYAGWQPEKSGFIGGLTLPGFCFVVAAVVVLLVPVYRSAWSGLLLSTPAAVGLVALAYVRVSGLSADEWLARATRHGWNGVRRRNVLLSGVFAPARADDPQQAQPLDLPGPLGALRFLDAPTGTGATAAVAHDQLDHTYTVVVAVSPPGLALAEVDTQNHRVASWGGLLAGLCVEDGALTRVGVSQRALPDDGTALASWVDRHTTEDAPAAAVANLRELLASAGPSANAREVYLTLTLDAGKARAKIKAAGGGDAGACAVLMRELAALRPAIAAAELQVTDVLRPRRLAEVIRTGFDPHAVEPLNGRRHAAANGHHPAGAEPTPPQGLAPGVEVSVAGPAAAETGWAVFRHDGAWTVTYQVRDWPRTSVYATVLQPLMKPKTNCRRSFSLVCEPLGPRRAERELSRERTKRQTLISLRRRTGRVDSADERRELDRSNAQDEARAAGHGILRFTALAAVTVTDPAQLEEACAELEADAAMARVELRRLWGAQDSGFAAACLPLGQGLPRRRLPL